jgi:hypothetical protein
LATRPSGAAIGDSSNRWRKASQRAGTSAAVNWQVESLWHHAAQLSNAPSKPTSWVSYCCSMVSPFGSKTESSAIARTRSGNIVAYVAPR